MQITLDRENGISLTEQVLSSLKRMILDGALGAGTKIPSTRELAAELGVSRTVTIEVYGRLEAEGFTRSQRGSGTYVAAAPIAAAASAAERSTARRTLHARSAARGPQIGFEPLRTDLIDFRTGIPDLDAFPLTAWQRVQRQVWSEIRPRDLAYSAPEGRQELREAISAYLRLHRGVDCDPGTIIITSGTTQAIGLITSIMTGAGRSAVFVEDPVTKDIPPIIERFGGRPRAIPVDGEGLQIGRRPRGVLPAFVYCTPSHHYPLGVTMSLGRRTELFAFARRSHTWIVEDDYDSEFRYATPPISTLYELAPSRVAYIGTFRKTLAPALRIGFVVLPPELVRSGRQAKWHTDLHGGTPAQLVLARFIDEGGYARHVARMRKLYRAKYRAMEGALAASFDGRAQIVGDPVGMHAAVRFPGAKFSGELLRRIEGLGAKVYPAADHTRFPERFSDTIVLGFGHLRIDQIEQGVEILRRVITGRAGTRRVNGR